MGGGTGHLPGQDIFYPGFKNCLYVQEAGQDVSRDGTFFIPG